MHRLGGEELRAEVDVLRAVPVLGRQRRRSACRWSLAALLTSTPIGPSAARDLRDRRAQRRDVGEVAAEEERRCAAPRARRRAPRPASSWMSRKATRAPCPAKARTRSAPMPDGAAGDRRRRGRRGWGRWRRSCGRSDQPLGVGVEQAGVRHVDAELDRLAHLRRAVGVEAADDLERRRSAARRWSRRRSAPPPRPARSASRCRGLAVAQVGVVAEDVLGPDAEDHLGARAPICGASPWSGSVAARAVGHREASPRRRRPRATISAGMKFIDGEPMKPATKMLAGRR